MPEGVIGRQLHRQAILFRRLGDHPEAAVEVAEAGARIGVVGIGADRLPILLYRLGDPPGRDSAVPGLPAWAPAMYQALHRSMKAGLVRACHDLSEGGLALAAAEMCIGGRLGLELVLDSQDPWQALFAEVNGSLLVEVRPQHCEAFEVHLKGGPVCRVGTVVSQPRFSAAVQGQTCLSLSLSELVSAWKRSS